jgi:hypothetical protein
MQKIRLSADRIELNQIFDRIIILDYLILSNRI